MSLFFFEYYQLFKLWQKSGADDAEFALIPEVRGLGKKFLEDWAKYQTEEKEAQTKKEEVRKHFKKK